jgi:hypothetical protein
VAAWTAWATHLLTPTKTEPGRTIRALRFYARTVLRAEDCIGEDAIARPELNGRDSCSGLLAFSLADSKLGKMREEGGH